MNAVTRGREFPERVYLRLNNNVGKADNGVLYAGRKPVTDYLYHHVFVKTYFAQRNAVYLSFFHQLNTAQNDACSLRYDRCDGSRPNAPLERADKKHVEPNVQNGRKNKIIKRSAAVTDRVHDAAADVVHYHRDRAEKIITEIFRCLRQNRRVSFHPPQKNRGERNTENGQYNAAHKPERDIRMYRARYVVRVTRAEIAGYNDTRAHGGAHKKAYQ